MSALSRIMNRLLVQSEKKPGEKFSERLSNNLLVEIKQQDGLTFLQISRSSTFPSWTEWRTVLRSLPYQIDEEPIEVKKYGRSYLLGNWSTPARLFQGVTDEKQPVKSIS